MSTITYIGYILKSKNIKEKTYKHVCENNSKHFVRQKDNFCSTCGGKVIKKFDKNKNTFLNLWEISVEQPKFENVIYPIEGNNELFFINSNKGKRVFESGFENFELSEEFFNTLKEEFENNLELQNLIQYVRENYGENSFEILERQLCNYYF